MRIIGITGGIGSGKSTVSSILAKYGARVIDADIIARQIAAKGEPALDEIVSCFGKEILDREGELNRKKLAEKVFNDKEKLMVLNTITHKYVVERILKEIENVKGDQSVEIIVLDVPIPIEHGFLDTVDEVWVVAAQTEVRVERVIKRSRLTYDEAIKRINAQKSDEEYVKIADRVIYNNDNLEELERSVKQLLNINSR